MARRSSNAAEWIDITMPFGHPAGTWPGDAEFRVEWTARLGQRGSLGVNLCRISSSPHNGTHSDAPYHVDDAGGKSDSLPLEPFLGPCIVVDAEKPPGPEIGAEAVRRAVADGETRILLRTRRGPLPDVFPRDFKGLAPAAAEALAAARVDLVGIDAPSVDRPDLNGLRAHRTLAAAGVVWIENLDLSRARPGAYDLVALPLKVAGLCAAPVRALLRRR